MKVLALNCVRLKLDIFVLLNSVGHAKKCHILNKCLSLSSFFVCAMSNLNRKA